MSEPRFDIDQWNASMGGVIARFKKEARHVANDIRKDVTDDVVRLLQHAYMCGVIDGFKQATAPPASGDNEKVKS